MSEENLTPETEVNAPSAPTENTDFVPRADVENLMKAVKSERGTRKDLERQVKEMQAQLDRFADVNPDEFATLQAEAAEAAKIQAQFGEQRELLEQKYSAQAQAAAKEATEAKTALAEYRKKYALEKVFYAAGGRTDAADGVSFFDMMAQQIGGSFRHEEDGSLTVIDAAGDPVLDKESGKRISAADFVASYKLHPIYGTFFKGVKGSGAGLGYGGTDSNGMVTEDLNGLSNDELFQRAFGS